MQQKTESASARIDARIAELADWRGALLARLRALIRAADPGIVEEWKWRGVPVWSHDGIVCTGESYKSVVKLTFARGASLPDQARLFNASLDGNVRRAIDFRDGDAVDEAALTALVRAAVAANGSSGAPGPEPDAGGEPLLIHGVAAELRQVVRAALPAADGRRLCRAGRAAGIVVAGKRAHLPRRS